MRARPKRLRTVAAVGVLAGLFAGLLTGCDATPSVEVDVPPQAEVAMPDGVATQLKDAVTHAMTAAGASGAIVGVWAPWSGTWTTAAGSQNMDGSGEISDDLRFRISRLTRPMICDVLYEVAAQGKVSLDDSPADYVAGTAELSEMTLAQLCDSTSGLASFAGQLQAGWLTNPTRDWDPRELASYGLGAKHDAVPGTVYRDSDSGYVLLGLALERITGMTAAELIEEYVVGPLSLQATTLPTDVVDTEGMLIGYVPTPLPEGGIDCAAPRDISDLSASVGYTDSGAVADLADVRTYVQALAAGSLVPDDADRFADAKPLYDGAPSWLTTAGGAILAGSLIGQSGAIPGYAVSAFADPDTGLTVAVVLNNSGTGSGVAQSLAWQLAAIASKAPAAEGQTAPEVGLPWTPEQFAEQITASAICPLPQP